MTDLPSEREAVVRSTIERDIERSMRREAHKGKAITKVHKTGDLLDERDVRARGFLALCM